MTVAVVSPTRLNLRSQPLKIAACPKCGHEAGMDYMDGWYAYCPRCDWMVVGYVWADTCLSAFLHPHRHYDRSR